MNYEVSTAGDKRFSALCAVLEDGRTIEMHYQCDIKGYDIGGTCWRKGKGRPPSRGFECTQDELYEKYKALWRRWLQLGTGRRAILLDLVINKRATLTDRFARGPINQARALTELAHEINQPVLTL